MVNNKHIQFKDIYLEGDFFYRSNDFLNIDYRREMLMKKSGKQGVYFKALSNKFGINVCDPTSDPRIIEYCCSIPYQLYYDRSMDRAFLRKTMRGLLPEEILNNTKFGLQVEDLHNRLKPEKEKIERILNLFKDNATLSDILNVTKMEELFKQDFLQEDKNVSSIIASKLLIRGLMVGVFILDSSKKL